MITSRYSAMMASVLLAADTASLRERLAPQQGTTNAEEPLPAPVKESRQVRRARERREAKWRGRK